MFALAYPPWMRLLVAALAAVAGASLPLILVHVVRANDPPVTPGGLAWLVTVWSALPALAAALLRRASQARLEVSSSRIVIARADTSLDVPRDAIAGVEPWTIPLPTTGTWLRLASGRRLGWALAGATIDELVAGLAAAGIPDARAALAHPTMVHAHARRVAARPAMLTDWRLKFILFPLLPGAVLFYTHQHIAYGGTFGQWYLESPRAWLVELAIHWVTTALYCVLFASVWRGVAEIVTLGAAWVAPRAAVGVRRAAEVGCVAVYYPGVLGLLVARYVA